MYENLPADVSEPLRGDAPLAVGDRVPDFVLPSLEGEGKLFYVEARGKPIVVHLAARLGAEHQRARLDGFARLRGADESVPAHCIAITHEADATLAATPEVRAFPGTVLVDPGAGAVGAGAFRVSWDALGDGSLTCVLDANQRVVELYRPEQGDPAALAQAAVERLRDGHEAQEGAFAPVLMIPRVFEPAFCRALIEFHSAGEVRETGVAVTRGGEYEGRVDHGMKRRFDRLVEDQQILGQVGLRLARRVLPEIRRAFCYPIVEFEGARIACYRASGGGYFRVHRDNDSPHLAHRRFALSLNLNTGEYEGGGLRFPEFGPRIYSPGVGEAIVFSCSLLHEAMDVTAGERYVLLGFMFGEDGVRDRAAMEQARRG